MPKYSTVTVKNVAKKEDWLKFRSICTLAGTDATKVFQGFVADVLKNGDLKQKAGENDAP